MRRSETLDSLLRLFRLEKIVPLEERDDLRTVRSRLERELGHTMRPAEFARLAGVTPAAVQKWMDKNEIATVLTRSGRREIPIREAIGLLDEVELARRAGRERALAAVIGERRRRAEDTIDIDRLLPRSKPRTHRDAELQSLAYHRAVADRLTPELVADALERVARWREAATLHPRWADEWEHLLGRPVPEIGRAISSDSTHARELRQTSPFAGVLTEQERKRLIDAVEARR
jgi:hypothetical protein